MCFTVPPGMDRPLKGTSKVTGPALKFQQLKALLIKRFHHHKRDVRSYLSQVGVMTVKYIKSQS